MRARTPTIPPYRQASTTGYTATPTTIANTTIAVYTANLSMHPEQHPDKNPDSNPLPIPHRRRLPGNRARAARAVGLHPDRLQLQCARLLPSVDLIERLPSAGSTVLRLDDTDGPLLSTHALKPHYVVQADGVCRHKLIVDGQGQ